MDAVPTAAATSLSSYLEAIAGRPLLSAAREKRLARGARSGDKRAKDELVSRNLRLVIRTAKKFRYQGLPFEDLIQEGNAGLVKAASRYNPDYGYRFSTYATWWIHQRVAYAVASYGRTIRLPREVEDLRHKAHKASRDFASAYGREPSRLELCEAAGLSEAELDKAFSVPRTSASLDADLRTDEPDSASLGAVVADPEQGDEVAGEALALLSRIELERIMGVLPGRYRWLVIKRYGLDGTTPATRHELAESMGVSYQQVGNIELEARRRLRISLQAHGVHGASLEQAS